MEYVVFRNLGNEEICDKIIDKRYNHILVNRFNPHEVIEWWKASIGIDEDTVLKNISVRQMTFDLHTNIDGLQTILNFNSRYLYIYQFDRPIPNTLFIDDLPEKSKYEILKLNGLKHAIFNELEDTIINSFDSEFINKVKMEESLSSRKII